jgi:hypothetical protein
MTAPWEALIVALSVVAVIQAIVLVGLLQRSSGVVDQINALFASVRLSDLFKGLPVGTYVPDFPPAKLVHGDGLWMGGKPLLILFAEPDCEPCDQLLRDLCSATQPLPWVTPLLVVSKSGAADLLCRPSGWTVLQQDHGRWTRAFDVSATPFAYVLDRARTVVAAGIPNSREDLAALASRIVTPAGVEGLPVTAGRTATSA